MVDSEDEAQVYLNNPMIDHLLVHGTSGWHCMSHINMWHVRSHVKWAPSGLCKPSEVICSFVCGMHLANEFLIFFLPTITPWAIAAVAPASVSPLLDSKGSRVFLFTIS